VVIFGLLDSVYAVNTSRTTRSARLGSAPTHSFTLDSVACPATMRSYSTMHPQEIHFGLD